MKAVRIHEYGGPEVLKYEEAPKPVPRPGDVLVRVHATSVNPVDWKIRAGFVKEIFKFELPLIPGWDLSGVVESVGQGVSEWKAGDEVFGRPDLSRDGAYAEYIAVRAAEIARKPSSVDHVHAASIPLTALTAWQALYDVARLEAGQKILIHAAAGGVGCFAVQFAKLRGAYVAGTASGRNQEFLRQLGVDQPIDYETTPFESVVHDFDVVLDAMGDDIRQRSWQTLKKEGYLVAILAPSSPSEAEQHGVRHSVHMVQANARQLTEIAALVDLGKVKAHVETVFPLSEVRQAHELSQTGHARGKIVLRVT